MDTPRTILLPMITKIKFDHTSPAWTAFATSIPRDDTWSPRLYIGVDPGENGAIAVFDGFERTLMWLPIKGVEGYRHLRTALSAGGDYARYTLHLAMVEKEQVSALMSPSSATTFMRNYGFGLGVIDCLALVTKEMTPVEWQKTIGLPPFKPVGDLTTAQLKAARKKHYTEKIRAVYGDTLTEVPAYAIDAFGLLLALT